MSTFSDAQVWFITGSSSGFGLAMTKAALAAGHRVVATLRSPSDISSLTTSHTPAQLLVLPLDVTSLPYVKSAFTTALATFGRIDVVFNNAGYAVQAELEDTPEDEARRMWEVDFWGMNYVSVEAVRCFRERNGVDGEGVRRGGLLLQNCSYGAVVGIPSFGHYSAAKHAMFGYSTTLQAELDPTWNIRVTSIITGSFNTESLGRSLHYRPLHPTYASSPALLRSRAICLDRSIICGDVDDAVQIFLQVAQMPREEQPGVLPLGEDAVRVVRGRLAEIEGEVGRYEGLSGGLIRRV